MSVSSASALAPAPLDFDKATLVPREIKLQAQVLIANVVKLDDTEGMLSKHLAELLGINDSTLRHHLRNHAIGACKVSTHRMRSDLGTDVIPIFARSMLFIPKDSILRLVKIINTAEAWAVYRELWEYAERFAALETERNQLAAERDQLRAERDELVLQRGDALAAAEALALQIGALTTVEQAQPKAKAPPRVRRYRVEECEFVATSVLHGPRYRTVTRHLRLDQMTREQRETHALQKGTISAYGFIKSAGDRMTSIGVENPNLLSKREAWQRAAEDFLHELIPQTLEFLGPSN